MCAKEFVVRSVRRALSYQVVRYLVVGGGSLLLNVAIFTFCTKVAGLWYVYATMVAGTLAWMVNFPLHRGWTFEDRRGSGVTALQSGAHFALKVVNTYAWDPYLIYQLVEVYGWGQVSAKIAVGLGIGVQNLVLCRYVIFRKWFA